MFSKCKNIYKTFCDINLSKYFHLNSLLIYKQTSPNSFDFSTSSGMFMKLKDYFNFICFQVLVEFSLTLVAGC